MTTRESYRPPLQPPADWTYPLPTEHVLSNGLRVLVHQLPRQQVVAATLVLDIPLSSEERTLEGIGTLCARTLDEGTHTYPGDRFIEVLETEGAAFSISHGFAGVQAMVDVPITRFGPALELLAEAVRRPELRDADITRHVALRRAELDQLRANSAQVAAWVFRQRVFDPTSRVQRLAGGETASLDRITPADVRAFHARHYGPAGATLVLAGDFTTDPVELAEASFGDWTNPDQDPALHLPTGAATPTAVLVDRPGSVQADLRLGGFGVDRNDPRWLDFQVGSHAVGGAFLSRLNRRLREELGYTYGVSLQKAPLRDGGSYAVAGSFRTEVLAPALTEARSLLDLTGAPITADEVTDAVNYLAGVSPLRYATAEGVADQTAANVLNGLPVDYVNTYLAGIRAATPETAGAAYSELIDLNALTLVVVGDARRLTTEIAAAGFDVTVMEPPR
jgi:zinc protease